MTSENLDRRITDTGLGSKVISMEERLVQGDKRMDNIETLLTANTAATKEVLEIVTMAKSFFKVLGYIGNAIKWMTGTGAAIAALWAMWPSGGPHK